MKEKIIVHISEIDISTKTGMGRVEHHWKMSFESAGYTFIHIGPEQTGRLLHRGLFPYKAFDYFKKLKVSPTAVIAHEPASGPFVNKKFTSFLESHGVERRSWEAVLNGSIPATRPSFKSRLLFPVWRLAGCDKGLKNSDKLLLINSDDKAYVREKYKREEKDIFLFKNGVNLYTELCSAKGQVFTVLFNGTWLERKGISVLIKAALTLHGEGICVNYLLIGTGMDEKVVLNDWPAILWPFISVVPHFAPEEEILFLNKASLFILPSFFEGQPLSLLQAMAAGKCCITTNCCGQKDIIQNGKTGILITTGDDRELATQIKRCFNSPDLMNEIGLNAKSYVTSLTWQNVSKQVVDYVLTNS